MNMPRNMRLFLISIAFASSIFAFQPPDPQTVLRRILKPGDRILHRRDMHGIERITFPGAGPQSRGARRYRSAPSRGDAYPTDVVEGDRVSSPEKR